MATTLRCRWWLDRGVWPLLLGGFLPAVFFWTCSRASAEAGPTAGQASERLVEEALRHELYGMNAQRGRLLGRVLEETPEYAPARWQSGYVRFGGRWVAIEDVPALSQKDRRRQEYLRVRSQYVDTLPSHVEMGRWCTKRRLSDQARAHFARVLELAPDHLEARRQLGHQRVGGVWVSPEVIERMRAEARQMQRNLVRWRPKVEQIHRGLAQRSERERDKARERLLAIDDPEAIAALESVLGSSSEEEAVLLVDALDRMTDREATLALARQAVLSEWPAVRRVAAARLRTHPMESFVPTMLAAMRMPMQSRRDVRPGPDGLVSRHAFSREGYLAQEETVFETTHVSLMAAFPFLAALGVMEGRAETIEDWAARQEASSERLNQRICRALGRISGEDLPERPEVWWQWWDETNETRVAYKPVSRRYVADQVTYFPTPPSPPGTGMHTSCFAAGTSVWTVDGPRPIEKLEVGDLVLSQDGDTGELAYKPVLRTTTATPAELVKVRTERDTFDCTGGHRFWVCGEGWVRARRLRAPATLHGAAGSVSVGLVESGPTLRTHNLVVADFNTYFVGRDKLLVHDVTASRPTATSIPGLKRP